MDYQNNIEFARQMDADDPLKAFRSEFLTPQHNGKDAIYFCGNSLGLQPQRAKRYLTEQLTNWQNLGVEGFFTGDDPWLSYHKKLTGLLAPIVGAKKEEIAIMNSLTVNLHLMMVSFYKPIHKRFKILMEGGAFPSDQYAVESQVRFHGYEPKLAIIEVSPREGEHTLRTADILSAISQHADELALVLFGGINYFTGQFFNIAAITEAAHLAGAYAGFDLAHAAGNVPLSLHNWNVDFACWCSYKYLNSGPGAIGGAFVHEKHFANETLHRFAGWWGYREDKRFLMAPGFEAEQGAAGWQLSTPPALLMALHKAALEIMQQAGGMAPLRAKGGLLTGYLEYLIRQVNNKTGEEQFNIITPSNPAERGSQLSIVCSKNARQVFDYLTENGIIGDWREPNVIRLSPVPLYNSFEQVFTAGQVLARSIDQN